MTARRYPWAPLERLVILRLLEDGADSRVGLGAVAEHLGLGYRNAHGYRRDGLTEKMADRLAVKAGLVPWQVWPEWLDHSISELTRECAAAGCSGSFVLPTRHPRKRYCSDRCRSREGMRRRYRANPVPKKEAVKAYDAANKDVKRRANSYYYKTHAEELVAYQRAYYQRNRDRILEQRRARTAAATGSLSDHRVHDEVSSEKEAA